jgi:phosphoribosylaminoimidazolecarboxamide formyltransferase/IMP cyclohydrolase
MKYLMKKRALLSVYDKNGIVELASSLLNTGWEILSTGGTAAHLTQNGVRVSDVSAVTGFPECLGGRVKTLHPAIHAGLLARRGDPSHLGTLEKLHIQPIDLVCVNLYPFFEKAQAGLAFDETVEFIDIGGPTMLRSAAKNFQDVVVLTDPADYPAVISALSTDDGVPPALRKRLAGKAFNLTSAYDAAVSRFMLQGDEFPPFYTVSMRLAATLRYGENAHQKAALYYAADAKGAAGGMKQLQGKELSYNNVRDLDIAWKCAAASRQVSGGQAFAVALKHNSPCGAAVGATPLEAYRKAVACDPVSIFGGIVGMSAAVDEETAREMTKTFLEVVVAPGFTEGALRAFAEKKNVRLLTASVEPDDREEILSVAGGILVQTRDAQLFGDWKAVTKAVPTEAQAAEMRLGTAVAVYAKSNAVLVVKDGAVCGIGAGQTNRIWAAEQALARAKTYTDAAGLPAASVLASDAFFPFRDCVDAAARYGIKAIVQPGGSLRDDESIQACDEHGIAMVFTGIRHFKH